MTGLHVVADIYCIECQSLLGWKYVRPALCFKFCAFTLTRY